MKYAYGTVLLVALAASYGCQVGAGPKVAGGEAKLRAADSAAFLDELAASPNVTEAQALRGVLLLLGEAGETTFAEAIGKLSQQKVVNPSWEFRADRPITKGRLAYMVYQACAVKGGVTLTLLGPSCRYCFKELQYRGLMTPGVVYAPVTGMECVGVLARADELRRTGRVSRVLSPEGGH